jgi:TRAP-type transport system periplasmic protein
MKRFYFFQFLMVILLVSFLFILPSSLVAQSAPIVRLTIGHDATLGSAQDLLVNKIVELAKEKSNGTLVLQNFPASQLGSNLSMLENTIAGSQDIFFGDLAFLGNFVKDYQIINMGFAFRDQLHIDEFMDSPIALELDAQLLRKGLLILTKHSDNNPRVMVSRKPIKKAEDIRGLKMRVPNIPIFLKVWEALGAKPASIPIEETYMALKQGVVDAMETPFDYVWSGKYYEGGKYVILTNHVRGTRGMLINPKKYYSLPKNLRALLLVSALEGEGYYNQLFKDGTENARTQLLKNGAIISEIDHADLQAKMLSLVNELEKQDFWSKGLYKEVQNIKY